MKGIMNKYAIMRIYFFLFTGVLFLMISCVSPEKLRKELVYFNGGLNPGSMGSFTIDEPVIQKGDLLQISISSRSASSNQLFLQNFGPATVSSSTVSGTVAGSPLADNGYLVDLSTGEIRLPLFGSIHADGMTKKQLEKEIITKAREYVKEDPIVDIRYLNFRVTFLGSVKTPGTKLFDSERVTFLQALGEVGGIDVGGDLENILLFREQNGKRSLDTIDLTRGDFFNSKNYYLKQNDVIYIRPTDRQMIVMDQSAQRRLQLLGLGVSFLNIIFILTNIFR
jgi:polysaccharide export outer membrane protein